MDEDEFETLDRYFRCANYLSTAQLYLLDNPLLARPLQRSDVKNKIVGHWGTVPGQNFIYTHLSMAAKKHDQDIIYISGPGHGGNFLVANSYIEGTYTKIYPDITRDAAGLKKLFRQFSFPCGISSHCAPEVPGSMHEGGELGYALSHGFGAVLDNPNLIAAVVVGDGEAETGPTACSWWGTKFLNPKTDGAVLPILHLNGYKISNPTLLARISKNEREQYFSAFGYDVFEIEVGTEDDDEKRTKSHKIMAETIDRAVRQIHKIWEDARGDADRTGNPAPADTPADRAPAAVKYPLVILKSPKGWTGVREADGKQITDSFRAHQVPVDMGKPQHLSVVEKWLKSYRPEELFNPDGTIAEDILALCPRGDKRITANPATYGGTEYQSLQLPNVSKYFVGTDEKQQDMLILSNFVADIIKYNPTQFRFLSPDEAKSNRLYTPFDVTKRIFNAEIYGTDEDLTRDGRIIDSVLSEHLCEGILEGYTLTGRHGFFASYESFARVVDSMLTQHAKWLKLTKDMEWRNTLPCLNLVATSHCWQQDHNGFTHQDPGLAAHLLDKDTSVIRAYYPPDANSLLAVFNKCMHDTHKINIITASKHPSRQWLEGTEALRCAEDGISVWDSFGTCGTETPDVVLACCGDTPTLECVAAVKIIKPRFPELKIRFVNVIDLGRLSGREDSLTPSEYESIFTADRPVIFVHHAYTNIIRALVAGRPNASQFIFRGYEEEGQITTGFDMRVLNSIDRYHIACDLAEFADAPQQRIMDAVDEFHSKLAEHTEYIAEHGIDPEWITNI
jgi:xylulose-5-phosphate/fructose-6-phosphate phosphoketolase